MPRNSPIDESTLQNFIRSVEDIIAQAHDLLQRADSAAGFTCHPDEADVRTVMAASGALAEMAVKMMTRRAFVARDAELQALRTKLSS